MFGTPWSHGSPVAILPSVIVRPDSEGLIASLENEVQEVRRSSTASSPHESQSVLLVSAAIKDLAFLHYFHALETILVLFAAHQEYFPSARLEKIYIGSMKWSNPLHANVQSHLLSALYPDTEIVTDIGSDGCEVDSLIYIDRRLTRTSINKMIDPVLALVARWAPALKSRVYKALSIEPKRQNHGSAKRSGIYVPRKLPRALTPEIEEKMFNLISAHIEVSRGEFAGMPWASQVRAAAESDLMLGVHGNGLSNLLWLPQHATVVEFFPEGVHHYDYQLMAEATGLDYFGIEGRNIYRPFSRHGDPYGHAGEANKPVSRLNEESLLIALRRRA